MRQRFPEPQTGAFPDRQTTSAGLEKQRSWLRRGRSFGAAAGPGSFWRRRTLSMFPRRWGSFLHLRHWVRRLTLAQPLHLFTQAAHPPVKVAHLAP